MIFLCFQYLTQLPITTDIPKIFFYINSLVVEGTKACLFYYFTCQWFVYKYVLTSFLSVVWSRLSTAASYFNIRNTPNVLNFSKDWIISIYFQFNTFAQNWMLSILLSLCTMLPSMHKPVEDNTPSVSWVSNLVNNAYYHKT